MFKGQLYLGLFWFVLFFNIYLLIGLHRVLIGAQWDLHWAHRVSCPVACGILVSQPGVECIFPTLQGGLLTTGPSGKSQLCSFLTRDGTPGGSWMGKKITWDMYIPFFWVLPLVQKWKERPAKGTCTWWSAPSKVLTQYTLRSDNLLNGRVDEWVIGWMNGGLREATSGRRYTSAFLRNQDADCSFGYWSAGDKELCRKGTHP